MLKKRIYCCKWMRIFFLFFFFTFNRSKETFWFSIVTTTRASWVQTERLVHLLGEFIRLQVSRLIFYHVFPPLIRSLWPASVHRSGYKYSARRWRRRRSGDRLCLSASRELLLLRIGIKHLNNPQASRAVVAIHSPPGGSRIKAQHPRLPRASVPF